MRPLTRKIFDPASEKDEKKLEEIREEWQKLQAEARKLRSKLPREYETHGWVWLFLRKG